MAQEIDYELLRSGVQKLRSIGKDFTLKMRSSSRKLEYNPLADTKGLFINEIGLVHLPLQANDVLKLADRFPFRKTKTKCSTNAESVCCSIDASQISLMPHSHGKTLQTLHKVTYETLGDMLDISFEYLKFNIKAMLKSLIICTDGESYQSPLSALDENGKFGTLFLQLPVNVNEPSGSIAIRQGTAETCLKFESNSCYSVAAVIGGHCTDKLASFKIQSDTVEVNAIMVFSLIWEDYSTFENILPSDCFPELFVATGEIQKALMPWNAHFDFKQKSKNYHSGTFLRCIPTSGQYNADFTISDLNSEDLFLVQSLIKIDFLDIHCASIKKRAISWDGDANPNFPGAYSMLGSEVTFDTTSSAKSIANDIFMRYFYLVNILVSDLPTNGIQKSSGLESVPVIVIRRRFPRLLWLDPNKREPLTLENFLEGLEDRLSSHTHTIKVSRDAFVRDSLLRDVATIVDMLRHDLPKPICMSCCFTRLAKVCIQLKTTSLAVELLEEVPHLCKNFEKWFICENVNCRRRALIGAVSFAKFVCLSNGWETHPDILNQLMNQLLVEGSFPFIYDIGLRFLQIGYLSGARKTLDFIIPTLQKFTSRPETFNEMFHCRLVALALYLQQEDEPIHKRMDVILDLIDEIEPARLTELVGYLDELNYKSPSYTFFMKKLGNVIHKKYLFKLSPCQFLGIIKVYNLLEEQELVKSIWTSICSHCVQFHASDTVVPCLLCGILRNITSADTQRVIVSALTGVEESKEAVLSSMQKLKNDIENVNLVELINLMGNATAVLGDEIFHNSTAIISRLSPENMFHLSCALFQQKRHLIGQQSSTMRKIYDWLLEVIATFDSHIIIDGINEERLGGFAWFGSPSLVKTIIAKLEENGGNDRKKISLILNALKVDMDGCCAASSLSFSREIFSFLMLELLKTLKNLDNRTAELIDCFKLLALSERSFLDSTDVCTIAEWAVLTESLTYWECVTVVVAIFKAETTNEGPSLKKFPPSWQVFTQLCKSAVSKLFTGQWYLTAENDAVPLVQCCLWIGEEKGIIDVFRLIIAITHSRNKIDNVLFGKIIRHQLTTELAMNSPQSLLALNDFIDATIQVLSRRLTYLFTEDSIKIIFRKKYKKLTLHHHCTLKLPEWIFTDEYTQCEKIHPMTIRYYTRTAEFDRWSVGTELQKEIDQLQTLRRKIMTEYLAKAKSPASV